MNMKPENTKEKVITNSKYPVLTRLIMETTLRIEEEKRLPHTMVGTCLPRVGWKKITPVIDNTIEEVVHRVLGESYSTLKDKSLQQGLKVYYQSVNPV